MRNFAFQPCIPSRGTTVPAGEDWLHEIKHDGYRLIVQKDGQRVRLFTRMIMLLIAVEATGIGRSVGGSDFGLRFLAAMAVDAGRWGDDARISDLEPKFALGLRHKAAGESLEGRFYCASRARTLMIERAVHLPPRPEGNPRSLSAFAVAFALFIGNHPGPRAAMVLGP
jgi:hypothetical protein